MSVDVSMELVDKAVPVTAVKEVLIINFSYLESIQMNELKLRS